MIRLIEDNRDAVEALCRKYCVAKLEVFGSAADETTHTTCSDVDFLVEFIPGAALGPWMSTYFDLKDELQRLLGRPVDLVMVGALRDPYFIKEVNRTRNLVYAS